MKILYRQILSELIGPFVFGVAAFTSIFFAGSYLFKLTNDIVNGMPILIALKLLLLYMPSCVVMTLPMATLLAVLLGFVRMSSDSEVVALYASGVSFYRIIVPVILFGLGVVGLTIYLNESVAPRSTLLSDTIRLEVLKEPISELKPVCLWDRKDGVTNVLVYANGGYDSKTQTLRDVLITGYQNNRARIVFRAKQARWHGGDEWSLSNGDWHLLGGVGSQSGTFREWRTKIVNLGMTPEEVALQQRSADEMTYRELRRFIASSKARGADTAKLQVNLYNKLALPLASLVFALIGAPLGMRKHRGGSSVGLGLSILIIFAYWMTWHFTVAMAKEGTLNPIVGAFLADGLGFVLGLFLIIRASK